MGCHVWYYKPFTLKEARQEFLNEYETFVEIEYWPDCERVKRWVETGKIGRALFRITGAYWFPESEPHGNKRWTKIADDEFRQYSSFRIYDYDETVIWSFDQLLDFFDKKESEVINEYTLNKCYTLVGKITSRKKFLPDDIVVENKVYRKITKGVIIGNIHYYLDKESALKKSQQFFNNYPEGVIRFG